MVKLQPPLLGGLGRDELKPTLQKQGTGKGFIGDVLIGFSRRLGLKNVGPRPSIIPHNLTRKGFLNGSAVRNAPKPNSKPVRTTGSTGTARDTVTAPGAAGTPSASSRLSNVGGILTFCLVSDLWGRASQKVLGDPYAPSPGTDDITPYNTFENFENYSEPYNAPAYSGFTTPPAGNETVNPTTGNKTVNPNASDTSPQASVNWAPWAIGAGAVGLGGLGLYSAMRSRPKRRRSQEGYYDDET